jgi:hypothetical protein
MGRVFGNIGEVDILALARGLNRADGKNNLDHALFLVCRGDNVPAWIEFPVPAGLYP